MFKGNFSFNLAALESLFKAKMPPLIGADISSSAIKMVEIGESGKGIYRVERYAIESWFFAKTDYPDGQVPLVW